MSRIAVQSVKSRFWFDCARSLGSAPGTRGSAQIASRLDRLSHLCDVQLLHDFERPLQSQDEYLQNPDLCIHAVLLAHDATCDAYSKRHGLYPQLELDQASQS